MSLLSNFRAAGREREHGVGEAKGGERQGRRRRKKKPTSLSGISSESSPTHTSGSYISKLISHIEAV